MKMNFLRTIALCAGVLTGVAASNAAAEVWQLPAAKTVSFKNIPDWDKEGFTLEVYCKVDKLPSGYAVLMRDSFGYPKFAGQKDIDCYLVNDKGNKNAAGRIYMDLDIGKYHYYVLNGTPDKNVEYRDGKACRTNQTSGIPKYKAQNTLHIGNSIGWDKNFTGRIAVVRIHKRALTDAEIKANYAALQNNQALAQGDSVIFEQDRRVTGNFYNFTPGKSAVKKAVAHWKRLY